MVDVRAMLAAARRRGRAVGSFTGFNLETSEADLAAAAVHRSPAIVAMRQTWRAGRTLPPHVTLFIAAPRAFQAKLEGGWWCTRVAVANGQAQLKTDNASTTGGTTDHLSEEFPLTGSSADGGSV